MKVELLEDITIEGRVYPACAVIDVFDFEAIDLIEKNKAKTVPDGTMARIKAYGTPGCLPQNNNKTKNK